MEIARRIIYAPFVNGVVRGLLKPFKPLIPKKFLIPVSGQISVNIPKVGSIDMLTNQTNCLTKDVFWNGIEGYEYPTIRIFVELIKKKNCFVDIGANIGYYSLIAAKVNPSVKIFAFEPMPSAFYFLEENIRINNFQGSIVPVKLAVADKKGQAKFFVTKNPKALFLEHHIGGSSTTARAKDTHSEIIDVDLCSLDEYFSDKELLPDIIKMDTEATEDFVLHGAQHVIKSALPLILCEVLPNRIEEKLEKMFLEFGYEFFLPEKNGLRKLSTLKGHQGEKDYFFVHHSKVSELQAFIIK